VEENTRISFTLFLYFINLRRRKKEEGKCNGDALPGNVVIYKEPLELFILPGCFLESMNRWGSHIRVDLLGGSSSLAPIYGSDDRDGGDGKQQKKTQQWSPWATVIISIVVSGIFLSGLQCQLIMQRIQGTLPDPTLSWAVCLLPSSGFFFINLLACLFDIFCVEDEVEIKFLALVFFNLIFHPILLGFTMDGAFPTNFICFLAWFAWFLFFVIQIIYLTAREFPEAMRLPDLETSKKT
jgi:hypothetical protein